MTGQNIKAIVFDRDGTLIEHIHYLSNPENVSLLPGVKEGLKKLQMLNCYFFLHTNQSGVGRKFFDINQVHLCNNKMLELLGLGEQVFEKICIATETPEDPILYRKPSPRFAKEIMSIYGFKPFELCFVGDRSSDLEVALELGSMAIGVNTGLVDLHQELKNIKTEHNIPVLDNFNQVVACLI